MAQMEKDYWKWDENFWRKSTEICRKMKDHQQLKNDFHRAGKLNVQNFARLEKNEENFEKFQESLQIFCPKSLWKMDLNYNLS